MWGRDILFHFPIASFAFLFLIPLLIGQGFLWFYRQKQLHLYNATKSQRHYLLFPRSTKYEITKMAGWSFIWLLGCLSLMGPYGNIHYPVTPQASLPQSTPLQYRPHEVIFLVDTSASMGTLDGFDQQSRLDTAKQLIEDIIGQLKGQSVSLYSFTSELTPIVPATQDYLFTRLATRGLTLNAGDVGGTNFQKVLQSLTNKLFTYPSMKLMTLILLSDGGDNQIESSTGEMRQKAEQAIIDALPNPQQFFIQSFIIGIGGSTPQPIPHVSKNNQPVESTLLPAILQLIATYLKGSYETASQWSSWSLSTHIVEQIGEDPLIKPEELLNSDKQMTLNGQSLIQSDLYFQIPLGVALLFYCLNLLLPEVEKKP